MLKMQNNCIFCSKDASEEFLQKQEKKPVVKRETVHFLTCTGKETIVEFAEKENDAKCRQVLERENEFFNFDVTEIKYHRNCCKNFFHGKNYEISEEAALDLFGEEEEEIEEPIETDCSICTKSLSQGNTEVAKVKIIKKMVSASLKRKDEKHIMWEAKKIIKVHVACRTFYTDPINIAYCLPNDAERKSRLQISELREKCSYCLEDVSETFLKRERNYLTTNVKGLAFFQKKEK